MNPDFNDLTEKFAEVLVSLVQDHGYLYPIHYAIISGNDGVLCGTYGASGSGEISCDVTAESATTDMKVPINVMFVDSEPGEAALVQISAARWTLMEGYSVN